MPKCIACGKKPKRSSYKYCSNKCQADYQYALYIKKWKEGKVSGGMGIVAKGISKHVLRYLSKKYGEKCSICGWSQRNAATGKVPLESDHIDGNSENNSEDNLRLICPNCHSLSNNFRNLNRGRGRVWRMLKYKRN